MTCGIYSITSPSGNSYIGSSIHIELRFKQHVWACKRKAHRSEKLQRAYYKYEGNLTLCVLQVCTKEELLQLEQKYLDIVQPEYNTVLSAENPMRDTSSAAKALAAIRTPKERKARRDRAILNNQAATMHTEASFARSKAGNSTPEARAKSSRRSKDLNSARHMHTPEAKAKSTAYRKSKAGREALSKSHDTAKKAVQNINTGIIYDSLMATERATGINHSNLSKAIRNNGLCQGCEWRYVVKCSA
jgi:group I intron endonuclease